MADKIKILHVIKTLNLGGAEVNLYNFCRAIDTSRFEMHVAYSFGGELEPKFKALGVRLFKYAAKDNKVKSMATPFIVARLAGYIRRNRIRIIHTHNFSAHLWGCLAAKLGGAKIVEHVHDFRYLEPEDFARRRGFNNQYKFVYRLKNVSDRVVVLTRQNEDFLVRHGLYGRERIREFQNGIFIEEVRSSSRDVKRDLMQQYGLPAEAMIILTPIRIAPEKNADLIVRVAADVVKQVPQAVFLIAGDGPLSGDITAQIKAAGLEPHVRLIGYHADIQRLLQGTDVFLLPSFLELHSIAILEAMSMGVPVVVSQGVGCNDEFMKQGVNGFLADPFQDEGWARALVTLLKDEALRARMGAGGRDTCRSLFDIHQTIKRFEDLYVELCNP